MGRGHGIRYSRRMVTALLTAFVALSISGLVTLLIIVGAVGGGWLVTQSALSPIRELTMAVRRIIRTPGTIADDDELERVRQYRTGETSMGIGNAFDAGVLLDRDDIEGNEPFALLHAEME